MSPEFSALISVSIVSLISFVGAITLCLKKERIKEISFLLVAFSVGALFGGAFFHLLPEAFLEIENTFLVSSLIFSGVFLFFLLEKFLRWRHCHQTTSKNHPHPLAVMNLVGDGVHNLIDGMLIGAGFMVNQSIGIALTIAVVFHEIPQEIGDFGVLLYAGVKPKRAILFNFLTSLSAFLGVIVSIFLGLSVKDFSLFLLPIAAGGFIYIAGSDLIPELHKETSLKKGLLNLLLIVLGAAIMLALLLLE